MNHNFVELLNFMIPSFREGLNGSHVWKSCRKSRALEAKFQTLVEMGLNKEILRELNPNEPTTGSILYDFIQKQDNQLLSEVGNLLIECWFTNSKVLESYGIASRKIFPHGKRLRPTDWTILEPVFLRDKLYRE